MTDNEIIKALECCGKYHTNYKDQPCEHCAFNDMSRCIAFLIDNVIGLINRQKAEVENYIKVAEYQQNLTLKKSFEIKELKAEIEKLDAENDCLVKELDKQCDECVEFNVSQARKKAIKEFAERLKHMLGLINGFDYDCSTIFYHIDNLVKEMVGDTE